MRVSVFVPYSGQSFTRETVEAFRACGVERVVLLDAQGEGLAGCESIKVDSILGSNAMSEMLAKARRNDDDYALVVLHDTPIRLGQFAVSRFLDVAGMTGAGLVYSDYVDVKGDKRSAHPVNEYQPGSVRDGFEFGSLVLIDVKAAGKAIDLSAGGLGAWKLAGWYALRLAISRISQLVRIAEPLYMKVEPDTRRSGEKQFDYVDPRNRDAQIEMELVATSHLKAIGAFLEPTFKDVDLTAGRFPVEASVIIPVRNRVKTVGDAVRSVLTQKTSRPFNVIVVDNHSTDGTTELLRELASDPRVVHVIPGRDDLGIGGCWNVGIDHASCGRFALQLDSDDLYAGDGVIEQIVGEFYAQRVPMIVGSYRMTNFELKEIPPGVIDHREWTPDNGHNNALRINGLGAPRCFYTPLLRSLHLPNVSYGEDYAMALRVCREYRIGRIYEPIYLCRRWDGNSDADLDIVKSNTFNHYKDKIRTLEIAARQRLNRSAGR
jgi:hypothetical protein